MVPIPFILYALLVCLIVNLLLTKTLSDSRFYVSSYYLGLFIHVGMGRLGKQVTGAVLGVSTLKMTKTSRRLCILFSYMYWVSAAVFDECL